MSLNQSNLTDTDDTAFVKIVGGTDAARIENTGGRLNVNTVHSDSSISAPMVNRVDASSTVTTTGNTGTLETKGMACGDFLFSVSTISGTSPNIQFEIETSNDGTNWDGIHSTGRITTTGTTILTAVRISEWYYRIKYFINGTTPSISFTVTTTLKAYLPNRSLTFIRYSDVNLMTGSNTSSIFKASGLSTISLIMSSVTVGGGSASVKIQSSSDRALWVDVTSNIVVTINSTILQSLTHQVFPYFRVYVQGASTTSRFLDLYWGGISE